MLYPGNDLELGTVLGSGKRLILSRRDRARHTYAVGATRTGKTKLLEGMTRQDLLSWPNHQCPLIVIDPHGTLYKGLIGYAAGEGLDEWPIIPLDLRRDDLVVSYNLLRRREGVDPAVVCRSFVDAIVHAWGQSNTNETPRLATWLETLLMLAYERECSLAEALQVIRSPELRRLITADVQHVVARTTLQSAGQLKEREFQDRVESTLYRVNRFLSTQLLRATLCQGGESLDLAQVLEQGSIVLANLSVEGTKIADEDAAALGSVLLTDLWTAARRRGKREEGGVRPCYVYIDEFQNFITPTIAKGLSEASGFGLHLHLAHQYPSQLVDQGGDLGKMVLNSVLANAKNKILFQLSHPEDLETLASILYRQAINPDKIKDEIYGLKVLGYELEYFKGYSSSTSHGTERSVQESHSEGHSYTYGTSESYTEGESESLSITDEASEGESDAYSTSTGLSRGESDSTGESLGRSESDSTSLSESDSENWSESEGENESASSSLAQSLSLSLGFGRPTREFQDECDDLEYELSRGFMNEDEKKSAIDAFKRKWAQSETWSGSETESESASAGRSASRTSGGGRSRSSGTTKSRGTSSEASRSHSDSLSQSTSKGRSQGKQKSRSRSQGRTKGHIASVSEGTSESYGDSSSDTWGESHSESESHTEGTSLNPMLVPVLGKELSSRQFASIEEQLFRMMQFLDGQADRRCVVRLASMKTPLPLFTRTIQEALSSAEWTEDWTVKVLSGLQFVSPMPKALQQLADREISFRNKILKANEPDEPMRAVRRIVSRPVPPRHEEK